MSNHIAFIGVGNMGNPMANQLVKAGKDVKVFDISQDVIKIAKQSGLDVINSMEELLQGATTVISMLPEGKHVRSLYLGDNGILKKIPKDCLIIDCSTIDIETSLELGNAAKKIGINMIDAPVTGGVMGARIGKLNFLVGGSDEAVAIAKPLLDIMGQKILHGGNQSKGGEYKDGFYYEPTLLSGLPVSSPVCQEEVFGPVACAIPFKSFDEVMKSANDTQFGLSAVLWTKDLSRALQFVDEIEAGFVQVNQCVAPRANVSYGGIKMSGLGKEYAFDSMMNHFTQSKTVLINRGKSNIDV